MTSTRPREAGWKKRIPISFTSTGSPRAGTSRPGNKHSSSTMRSERPSDRCGKEITMTSNNTSTNPGAVDMKLEVVLLRVSDVDRAKAFYENLGWQGDTDIAT